MAAVVASAPHLHHEPMDRFLKGPVIRQAMPIYSESYSEFTQSLKEEIPRVMREPHGYDSVSVLLSYWEEAEFKEVTKSALKLGDLFEKKYGFEVTPCPIPSQHSESNFLANLIVAVNKVNNKDGNHLFILYYGGHACYSNNEGLWYAYELEGSPSIKWDNVKLGLQVATCDLLVIFDCCYSTAILDEDYVWPRRCELLGASGAVEETLGTKDNFTQALADFLETEDAVGGLTVAQIYRRVSRKEYCHKYPLGSTPQLIPMTKSTIFKTSILLSPLKSSNGIPKNTENPSTSRSISPASTARTLQEATDETDLRIVLIVRFRDSAQKPIKEEWLEWVRLRPANLDAIDPLLRTREYLETIGLFDAD